MKLIVQIPCFNEAATLPQTVADIPREVPGVDEVELLIVDDGSSDDTVAVAERIGVDHIIRHKTNKGLAQTFRTGIEACLKRGADIIVNTDGDNQYPGAYIPQLIAPIIAGEADIVVGDRRPHESPHFSWYKRKLQKLGSFVVRSLSGTDVPDTVSGFRAISREAAIGINIMSPFQLHHRDADSGRPQQDCDPVDRNSDQRPDPGIPAVQECSGFHPAFPGDHRTRLYDVSLLAGVLLDRLDPLSAGGGPDSTLLVLRSDRRIRAVTFNPSYWVRP